MPNLALLQNPKYQALVDKIVDGGAKGCSRSTARADD